MASRPAGRWQASHPSRAGVLRSRAARERLRRADCVFLPRPHADGRRAFRVVSAVPGGEASGRAASRPSDLHRRLQPQQQHRLHHRPHRLARAPAARLPDVRSADTRSRACRGRATGPTRSRRPSRARRSSSRALTMDVETRRAALMRSERLSVPANPSTDARGRALGRVRAGCHLAAGAAAALEARPRVDADGWVEVAGVGRYEPGRSGSASTLSLSWRTSTTGSGMVGGTGRRTS